MSTTEGDGLGLDRIGVVDARGRCCIATTVPELTLQMFNDEHMNVPESFGRGAQQRIAADAAAAPCDLVHRSEPHSLPTPALARTWCVPPTLVLGATL